MVLMNLFHAPIWLYKIGRMGRPEDRHTKEERYEYIAKMDKRIIRRGRVDLVCTGVDGIPEQDGFIMFPNHQGLFDVLALFATCPRPFSVVIKKEAAELVLVKQVLGAMRSLPMDPVSYTHLADLLKDETLKNTIEILKKKINPQ